MVSLQVEGRSTGYSIDLPGVFTKRDINISRIILANCEDVRQYSHLDGIYFPSIASKKIGLLIDQYVPEELQHLVRRGGFQLMKCISNNPRVVESVPEEERAKEMKGLDLNQEAMPVVRALVVSWNLELDCIKYKISPKEKPLIRQ